MAVTDLLLGPIGWGALAVDGGGLISKLHDAGIPGADVEITDAIEGDSQRQPSYDVLVVWATR